jgi:hypothetical protein
MLVVVAIAHDLLYAGLDGFCQAQWRGSESPGGPAVG